MNLLNKRGFVVLMILSIFLLMGFKDNHSPVDKENQKKLEKAQKFNSEAQELNDKANSLYSEIAAYDISNPKSRKKAENLKSKALDNQLNALELQKEANFLEYSVYKKIIPGLKQDYKKINEIPLTAQMLEEKSNELFYKAETLRNEVYHFDKEEKENAYNKLTEAQEFEKEGIVKQKELVEIYLGNTIIEKDKQEISDSEIGDDILINDELLKAFLNYMDQDDSMSRIESLKKLIGSDSLSSVNLRNTWENYLYNEQSEQILKTLEQDSVTTVISKDIAMHYNDEKNTKETEDKGKDFINRSIIYKIQIAADKQTLSQNVLKKIYSGNKELKMIKEDGWNKYSIGDFSSFSEADNYRKKIGVNDAFVVGYENEEKVDLLTLNKKRKKTVANRDNPVINSQKGIIFKVQIAADKMRLSEEALKNIYAGTEKIDINEEDGWYKYSVGELSSYDHVEKLKKSISVDGAFIVAYKNGVKVPLYLAKSGRVLEESKSGEDVIFKIQIAADTKILASEKLHKIYSGFEKIQRYDEEGWYKYSLGEFKTFNEANKFREICKVKGAFVIAFQGGKKVNVLEAKKITRCYNLKIITDWITTNEEVIFRVQIAASNTRMSINQIKNIYCKKPNIYEIEENSWFKYSIGNFKNYQNSLQLKEKSGIAGAFVVAYKKGKKINISEAINSTKTKNN